MRNLAASASAIRSDSARHGFALLITITLLAFLLVLILSLALFTKVETQISVGTQQLAEARENTLMALNLAIGQLQKFAGPDQRATARAELAFTNPAQPFLTGVWDASTTPPHLLTWLVSGNETDGLAVTPANVPPPGFTVNSTQVLLAGAKSVGAAAQAVLLNKTPIIGANCPGLIGSQIIGNYAYWVSDEGVKASAAVADTLRATLGAVPVTNYPKIRLQIYYPGFDPEAAANATALQKVLSYPQLAFAGVPLSSLKSTFHQVTVCAYAVLTDPTLGALKTDRSYAGTLPTGNPWYDGAGYQLDQGFFSQNPPSGTDPDQLPVARLRVIRRHGPPPSTTELQSTTSARHLLVAGAFNLNSISASAWQAVLEAARTKQWSSTAAGAHGMAGSISLSDAQLAALASAIAPRMRQEFPPCKTASTPFVSLRNLALSGLLQAALDATTINSGKVVGLNPDYISPNDLLALLAPVLTTRSDTFVIRAYGEVQNPARSTSANPVIEGCAWCEAMVQRLPDYVDATQDPTTAWSGLNPTNGRFGRRFQVIAFRWLSPDDL